MEKSGQIFFLAAPNLFTLKDYLPWKKFVSTLCPTKADDLKIFLQPNFSYRPPDFFLYSIYVLRFFNALKIRIM